MTIKVDIERPTAIAQIEVGPVEYRLDRRSGPAIVVFHGGHMRAALPLGESVFADCGYTVLVPSRPGYGRTPLRVADSPSRFADVVRELCSHLGIEEAAAVLGISAGGRAAIAMAAHYPEFVHRLILQSAVSYAPWPGLLQRAGSWVVFNAITGRVTWAVIAMLIRLVPSLGLRVMMRPLSTEPIGRVVEGLEANDRAELTALFSRMRSGRGFLSDLRASTDLTGEVVQPTLIIAAKKDASVPFTHAESLAASIRGAELIASDADNHFIWLGRDYARIAERIRGFLGS